MLSRDGRDRIEAAIREAERGTAGEIVVVLARQAGSYKSLPLAYGFVAALAVPWPLIWLTGLSAAWIVTIQAAAALACLAVSAALGLALVPGALRRARAREAAAREFAGRGMAETSGRTGILLHVALAERHAEVLGDVSIAAAVGEAEWRTVIEALVAEIGAGRIEAGLVAAVARIGAILATHVPPGSRDLDELPNRVVVL